MTWTEYLFSFKGRLNRARYWAFVAVALVFFMAIFILVIATGMVGAQFGTPGAQATPTAVLVLAIGGAVIAFIAYFVASLAISAKRLHDRNRSAWWIIPFVILPSVLDGIGQMILAGSTNENPVGLLLRLAGGVLSIWAFVELGCLKGTTGPNRFGSDPLGGGQDVAEAFS